MAQTHQTERLLLSPWEPSDLEAFHAIWGDPKVIFWGANADVEASRALLEKVRGESAEAPDGFGWFAVREQAAGEVCANVFLQPYRYGPGWELGYHVARSSQGRGYATEASRALIDFALATGQGPVTALVLPDNAPSQRVVHKLGLARVGTRMHADLLHDVFEARQAFGSRST